MPSVNNKWNDKLIQIHIHIQSSIKVLKSLVFVFVFTPYTPYACAYAVIVIFVH